MNKLIVPDNLLLLEPNEPESSGLNRFSISFYYRFRPEIEQWWKEQTTTVPRIRTEVHISKQFVFHWIDAETKDLATAFKMTWY